MKIPQREDAHRGILLRLGDFGLKSWFQEGSVAAMADFSSNNSTVIACDEDKDWWRMLALSILGLGWEAHGGANDSPTATKQMPVDLLLELRKPTSAGRTTLLKGSLSYVDLLLAYSDYVLFRAVLRENIGRKIDMERWDNVEKAYWMEEASAENVPAEQVARAEGTVNHRVAYSSNARFVRYGKKSKVAKPEKRNVGTDAGQLDAGLLVSVVLEALPENKLSLDFKFDLGGLRLTLHRDDPIDASTNIANSFNYDVVLVRVENIETTMTKSKSGDFSFHLSLYRMGVFDLGDIGRLARHQYFQNVQAAANPNPKKFRNPSAFCVLAEGYSASSQPDGGTTDSDAQLVVTVDTCPASSIGSVGSIPSIDLGSEKVTIARVVVNHLSVNALVRPIREIGSFLACAWPNPRADLSSALVSASKDDEAALSSAYLKNKSDTKSSGFQLKLVAHYPRIFFCRRRKRPSLSSFGSSGVSCE